MFTPYTRLRARTKWSNLDKKFAKLSDVSFPIGKNVDCFLHDRCAQNEFDKVVTLVSSEVRVETQESRTDKRTKCWRNHLLNKSNFFKKHHTDFHIVCMEYDFSWPSLWIDGRKKFGIEDDAVACPDLLEIGLWEFEKPKTSERQLLDARRMDGQFYDETVIYS